MTLTFGEPVSSNGSMVGEFLWPPVAQHPQLGGARAIWSWRMVTCPVTYLFLQTSHSSLKHPPSPAPTTTLAPASSWGCLVGGHHSTSLCPAAGCFVPARLRGEAGGVEKETRWWWAVVVCLIRSCLISTPLKNGRESLPRSIHSLPRQTGGPG